MANFGLNKLLAFSVPLLQIIYPVALVLIVMGISHKYLNYSKVSYVSSAIVAVGLPLVEVLDKTFNVNFGFVTNLVKSLALYEEGLAWLLPTIFVLVLTSLLVKVVESFIEVDKIRQKY